MGALTSIPLCQRARGADEVGGGDNNNNLHNEEDRNIPQVVEVQPEATSTPKVLRRIEPLPEDRDLGDSSNSDSLESELEVRAVSERTFGSDSGLEQSGDELEATREVEVHQEEEDTEEEEEETVESLQTGDLGVDRAKTFRVEKEQPPLDMEFEALADEFSEPLPNEESEEEEEEEETNSMSRKLAELGVSEEEEDGVSNMLSDLTQNSRSHEM